MKAIYSRIMSLIILSSLLAGLGLNPIQGSQAAPSGADIAVESPWKLETIGQISGPVRAVTVEGSYAYVGSGDMLTIFDLSSPASPLPVGSLLSVFSGIEEIKVAQGYAYVSDGSGGVWVVDVSDPAHPLELGYYDTPSFAHEVAVVGTYLYVADFDKGLRVVDVSDPAAPLEVGALDWVMTYSLDVAGNVAFLANVAEGLKAVDISDPAAPFEISTLELISDTMDVTVAGGYAYVANDLYGLKIVDVSDPAQMVEVGAYDTPGYAMEVVVSGSYAYVADSISGLQVIDISNPAHPQSAGAYDTPGWTMQAAAYGDYAYIADYLHGLWVVEASNPTAITLVGAYRTPADAFNVTISGNLAYVTDVYLGLMIIDISNPALPAGLGLYDSPGLAYNVAVAGNFAYLADGYSGLRIVDVSDPANPVEAGFYDTPSEAFDVAVAGSYAYIADGLGGLHVVDVSDPAQPVNVYTHAVSFADKVVISGNTLYLQIIDLTLDTSTIQMLDITEPTAPVEMGVFEASIYQLDVAVQGDYLYLAGSGLRVVDVSDPANPAEVGFYATALAAYGVAVSGSYAYLTTGGYDFINACLRVIDISDPTSPVEISTSETLYAALGVAVAGDTAYVTADGAGLYVMQLTPPLEDTTFRVLRDGFSFPNYPVKDYGDYTIADMQRMFGESAVCWMAGTGCAAKPQAALWNVHSQLMMEQGRSYGMAVSGLRFLQGLDTHPQTATVYEMGKDSQVLFNWETETLSTTLRREIGFFLASQFVEPVRSSIHQALQATPNEVLAQVQAAMQGDDSDPLFLVMRTQGGGHALVPYALSSPAAGTYWVWVYDNQAPSDPARAVIFDTAANAWSYAAQDGTWSGDAGSHALGVIPASLHSQSMQCPWCASTTPSHLLTLAGDGHLLITDSHGRQLGYLGDQYREQIPGGYGLTPVLGSAMHSEPVYTLPLTETYQVLLDGQTLTQSGTASLWQFGPGYAAAVQGLSTGPATQDQFSITSDGTQLSYLASQPQAPAFSLALDSLSASYGLNVQWLEVGAGERISLRAYIPAGNLILDGSLASGGLYNLLIRQASSAGVFSFYHSDIALLAGDTHIIHFGGWDGTGPLTLEIDHGSDGEVDETIELENQVKWYALPLVVK